MTKKFQRQAIEYTDELASSISWCTMRPHVSNETRNCMISRQSDDSRLLFAPIFTLQYVAAAVGVGIAIFLFLLALSSLTSIGISMLAVADPNIKVFTFLFGAVALTLIANLLSKPARALVFNKSMGVFWIEKRRVFGVKVGDSAQMPLSQIYALQIISNKNRADNTGNKTPSVTEYEINVVFRNGERVNIITHGNGTAIRDDASKLAEFLGVPVWDREIDIFTTLQTPAAEAA